MEVLQRQDTLLVKADLHSQDEVLSIGVFVKVSLKVSRLSDALQRPLMELIALIFIAILTA
jgi:hypothetical protein